jgi:hypothetical protein
MGEGELKKRLAEIPIQAGWGDIDREERKQLIVKTIDAARIEYPTRESVIAKRPNYWKRLEGLSQYGIILRNEVDDERSQWFLKYFGGE